jgi:hypothetical protein
VLGVTLTCCCCCQVYDNCRMLSTTGELLCFCDMRKLQWYVDRGLAERVLEEPPTIRLLFEHKNADQQVRRRRNTCYFTACYIIETM